MTQIEAIVLLMLTFVATASGSYWTGREAIRAAKKWKGGLDQPLIELNENVAENVPVHWPLNSLRWPQPTVDGERKLSHEVCALYAHEAWRKYNRVRGASELALVVGGAWLGTTLPVTIRTLFAGDDGFVLGVIPAVMVNLEWWGMVAPLAVIWIGLSLQSDADGIGLVRETYLESSSRTEAEGSRKADDALRAPNGLRSRRVLGSGRLRGAIRRTAAMRQRSTT